MEGDQCLRKQGIQTQEGRQFCLLQPSEVHSIEVRYYVQRCPQCLEHREALDHPGTRPWVSHIQTRKAASIEGTFTSHLIRLREGKHDVQIPLTVRYDDHELCVDPGLPTEEATASVESWIAKVEEHTMQCLGATEVAKE
ncbi:hypothetical protein Purlil1_112 [Purpureocillium lilacinum]|uniref:Uncharacterized protein n=1 Tax=Purpureocillium lilacinum TaxID=33203 RepID=A0ABR0CHA7_PURLI|nr:hypothetical protein Purlil1_112 [Purpureocillium lilacinum]